MINYNQNTMSRFKKIITFVALLTGPLLLLAQERDALIIEGGIGYASIFTSNFSLLLSIVIGAIATFYVFRAGNKMGGGLFGLVLNYVGVGMIFIVLGTISMVIDAWFATLWFDAINTALFALGYIFLVIGANKLLKGIMST